MCLYNIGVFLFISLENSQSEFMCHGSEGGKEEMKLGNALDVLIRSPFLERLPLNHGLKEKRGENSYLMT